VKADGIRQRRWQPPPDELGGHCPPATEKTRNPRPAPKAGRPPSAPYSIRRHHRTAQAEAPRRCRRHHRPPGAARPHAEGAAAPDFPLRQGESASGGARAAVVAARIGQREDLSPSASPRPPTTTGTGEDARRAPAETPPPIGPRLIRRRRRRGPRILQRRRRASAPRRKKHPVVAAAAAARQGRCAPTPRVLRPPIFPYTRGKARLAEPATPSSQRESDDGKTSPRRRHRARRRRREQARTLGRPALASPVLVLDVAECRGSAAPGTHRVDPSTTPSGPGAVFQSAPAPEGRFVAMRAGGARTVGSISSPQKRRATPTIANGDAEFDRVGDALDASPSRPLSSTPPKSSRRRLRPSVLGDAPHCQRAETPFRGVTCRCSSARVVVPTTRGRTGRVRRHPARASPLPLLNGADREGSAAASTHRCETTRPLPGRSAGDQAAPYPEGLLVGVRAGGAGSVGSFSVRGKSTAAPMSAGYGCGSDCGGAVGDLMPSLASVLRLLTSRCRYRSSPPCVLGSHQYLRPPSLELRDTSRVLPFLILLATE